MKRIPLRARDGSIRDHALVDDVDFQWLSQWRWHLSPYGYAMRTHCSHAVRRTLLMHRQLMGEPTGLEVDHITPGTTLDNRRFNLRVVTCGENMQNRKGANRNSKSGVRGVGRVGNRWRARVTLNYKDHYLGRFGTKEEAESVVKSWRAANMSHSKEQ